MNPLIPISLLAAGALAAPTSAPDGDAPKDIVEVAASAGKFETLLAAAEAAGLVDALKGDGPLTVLAPTDEAFAKLGGETIATLLKPENKDQLVRILTYHVISGAVGSTDALEAESAPTLAGPEVSFALNGGRLTVNGDVKVVANDIAASNGVIHVIDTVLIPPTPQPEGRLVIGFFSEQPSDQLARYLGVDPHATRLVTRVTEDSEAEKAGLEAWDLIVGINGQAVTEDSIAAVKEEVGYEGAVELSVLRRGQPLKIKAKVGIERH